MRHSINRIFLLGVLSVVVLGMGFVPDNTPVVVYLIRHAEKTQDHPSDPTLTPRGQERAHNLAAMLREAGITHLHTTDFKRTRLTLAPIADELGLEVVLYNPQDLWGFAQTLRTTPGVHVVAGHSNTTPELVHYLGGDPGTSIDDSEYERLYQLTLQADQPTQTALLHVPPYTERLAPGPIAWETEHVVDARNTYRMSFQGQEVGTATWTTSRADQHIRLHEKTVLENFGVDADIEVLVSPTTLLPLQMSMSGTMFQQPSEIDVVWENNRVQGASLMARAPFKPQGEMRVDVTVPQGTIERSSALFLAAAMPFEKGPFAFHWFNAYDGEVRPITVRQTGDAEVTVPAGTFDTYLIELKGGAPSQRVYITKETPRTIVKIEVISMPWVYELLAD